MSDNHDATQFQAVNPWPLNAARNPYLHNVFVLLGINPDSPQKDYDRTLAEANTKISADSEWFIHGHKVDAFDTSRGEQLAKEGADFVGERLLVHTNHEIDTKDFKDALKAIDDIHVPKAETLLPLPVRDLTEISRRFPQQVNELVGTPHEFPRDRLLELFRPAAHEEQIFDL